MLGYVRTDNRELRLRELECYRGLYCGLCKSMGSHTGQRSRLSLSYDFVFLAALRGALTGERPTFRKRNCMVHPFRRRLMAEDAPSLEYCAHASALLSYHKCLDDRADEKGGKRIKAFLARMLLRGAYKRARRAYPVLDGRIRCGLEELSRYEKRTHAYPSADEPGEIFGGIMAEVFSHGLPDDKAPIARELGRAMGHWIYLADAADDLFEDKKRGRYNPLLLMYGQDPAREDLENIRLSMLGQLSRCEAALDLVESPTAMELKEILCNILYLGMPERGNAIIENAVWQADPANKGKKKKKSNDKRERGCSCCCVDICGEDGMQCSCECCGEVCCAGACECCCESCDGIG